MITLLAVFFGHFLGDFIFQTNAMAIQKSKSLRWLTIHVLAYTAAIFTISSFIFSWQMALEFAAINALLHWITDYFTSKLTARLRNRANPKWFFTAIGLDQFIHGACLIVTLEYFDLHQSLQALPNLF